MKLFTALVALFFATAAFANHEHNHMTIGERTEDVINILVCDTEDQMMSVIKTHENLGEQASLGVLRGYQLRRNNLGESLCGMLQFRIEVKRIVYKADLTFEKYGEKEIIVAEILAGVRTFYAAIGDFDITE